MREQTATTGASRRSSSFDRGSSRARGATYRLINFSVLRRSIVVTYARVTAAAQ
jgi:hypothetical protein